MYRDDIRLSHALICLSMILGTLACAMISAFGAVFCGILAIALGNNYQ